MNEEHQKILQNPISELEERKTLLIAENEEMKERLQKRNHENANQEAANEYIRALFGGALNPNEMLGYHAPQRNVDIPANDASRNRR